MILKQFTYLILSVLLLSCADKTEGNDNSNGSFSEDEARELANLLNSSPDSSNLSIVEEKTIGTKSTYSDSIWKIATSDLTRCQNWKFRSK